MKRTKLLYITFIDMENLPTSGSSVRPQKMLQAFCCLNVDVKLLSGMNNNLTLRKQRIREAEVWLDTCKPDYCYIEPPSGPMFCREDIRLIKKIHKLGIPIALFYRDAYWKYPDYYLDKDASITDKTKQLVIKVWQQYQWRIFTKFCSILYFPSQTMADLFEFDKRIPLPPGCFKPDIIEKKGIGNPVTFIFVGGAAANYGTFLTLDSFEKINQKGILAKLIYVCPENQWNALGLSEKAKQYKWLELVHTSGDKNLRQYYEAADVALLTAPRTFYRDFAVPIKIYEYISYLKPVLVTNCTETAKIITDNKAGWVVEDNINSIYQKIEELISSPDKIEEVRHNLPAAREKNLWKIRAERVLKDLYAEKHK